MSSPLRMSWIKVFGTPDQDYVYSLAMGSDGGIYVAGETRGDLDGVKNNSTAVGLTDAFVKKYNADGTVAWTRMIGGPYDEVARSITTDTNGSVYVVGDSFTGNYGTPYKIIDGQQGNGSTDIIISKFNSDGSKSFTKLIGTNESDSAFGVSVSKSGDIYVIGRTLYYNYDGQKSLGSVDILLLKLSPDGSKLWSRIIGTPSTDNPIALAVGSDESVYVLGETTGNLVGQKNADQKYGGTFDVFLTKVLPSGGISWSTLVGGSSSDTPTAITTSPDGSVYVTGYTNSSDFDGKVTDAFKDGFVVKFNQDGTKVWSKLISTNSHDAVKPNSVKVGADGSIYVAGYVSGVGVNYSLPATTLNGEQKTSGVYGTDAFVVKYNPDGTTPWTSLYGITSTQKGQSVSLIANSLGVDSTGNSVYIAGYTDAGYPQYYSSIPGVGGYDGFLLKLSNINSITKKSGTAANDSFNLTVGDESIDGGLGIDTVIVSGAFAAFGIIKIASDYNLTDKVGVGGLDILTNIERLKFADKVLALDLEGNSGNAARLLAAVFGKDAVKNPTYAGIAISLFDQGYSKDQVSQVALNAVFGPNAKSKDVVSLIWKNLTGSAIDSKNLADLSGLIDSKAITAAQLTTKAADLDLTAQLIDLVGLSKTGWEYIPYGG